MHNGGVRDPLPDENSVSQNKNEMPKQKATLIGAIQQKGSGGSYCSKVDHYFRSKLVQVWSILNFRSMDAWRLFTIAHGRTRNFCPRWRTREDPEQINRALWPAGDTGRATILTGRNHGEDGRQSGRYRGQARGEAGRARLHQQALRTQIRPAPVSRPRQHHLDSLLGWCTNYHGAQKGTLDRAETIRVNIRPAPSFAE